MEGLKLLEGPLEAAAAAAAAEAAEEAEET